ncbi:MAG: DEAD/DEAH box helicase [Alcaligenaceae bacterium]|nr:MAG: DEAD/DEAH box helicase [Alcaligenaceae bacterium]
MTPQKFNNEHTVKRSYERVFSDVEIYRSLGSSAGHAIEFGDASVGVRDYQLHTWAALRQARNEGKDSALLHLATGLGKTTVGVVDALDFASDFYEHEGRYPKIMFAVHQTEILDQAAARFREFAPSLEQGTYASGNKETDNPLTFATMQSLAQNLDSIDPNEFDYIMYDEAHHAQAETYKEVIKHFTPSFQLALTATPDRMDNADIRELFGDEVYSKPLHEAMGEGYLADVDYHIVFDDAVKRAMDSGFTSETLSEIRELLTNESRNEEIALQIWDEMERIGRQDAKTIVFCQDINQADEMAKLLGGKAYHSNTEDRVDILNSFRNNNLQIITTRDMFNEGMDVPDAQLLVFLRSTSSRTIFEQQLGRGLRKHPGKASVSVLDFVANIERLTQVKELMNDITRRQPRDDEVGNTPDRNNDNLPNEGGSKSPGGFTISTAHAGFDFDKMSVMLLERINEIRERANKQIPASIEEAAALWRQEFGDEEPTQAKIKTASEDDKFISNTTLHRLGGVKALRQELGFVEPPRPAADTIQEAATLWRQEFGDEKPTNARINAASKAGRFVSMKVLLGLGGKDAFNVALGLSDRPVATTLQEAADLWRSQFGDEEPTVDRVNEASKRDSFVSIPLINSFGGVKALKRELGFEVQLRPVAGTIQEAADLWRQEFGDEEPSSPKINNASKSGRFVSKHIINSFGGLEALLQELGFEKQEALRVDSIKEAATLWRQEFGDEEPTNGRIRAATKDRRFVSLHILNNFGGIDLLRQELGFKS